MSSSALCHGTMGQGSWTLSLAASWHRICRHGFYPDMGSLHGETRKTMIYSTLNPPPSAFISGVQSKDVQLFLWLLWVVAQEAVPVLMQIVDQVPIEAVLGDDVNGACGDQNRLGNGFESEQISHELLYLH